VGLAHVRNAALILLVAFAARAHEIGTTQVHLDLHRDRTWSASITTAPLALLNKLEIAAHAPRSANLDADALRAKLTAALPQLAPHIDLRFDGVTSPAALTIAQLEMPPDQSKPSFVVLRASGAMPAHVDELRIPNTESRILHSAFGIRNSHNGQAPSASWSYDLAYSTYALTFVNDGSAPTTIWIEADATQALPMTANVRPPTRGEVIVQYLILGFEHILPRGLDHILFILGIFLLTTRVRPILAQVTAFTIAHSITLGLTMYGIVSLSARIVEPLIAVSIAYVAIENVVTTELKPWRPAVVFAFGLLHGMGFAGVLRQLRLPRGEFIPALVSFNVGIEVAQLTVIAVAFVLIAMWFRERAWYRPRFVVPASAAIAATGLLWTVQRIVG